MRLRPRSWPVMPKASASSRWTNSDPPSTTLTGYSLLLLFSIQHEALNYTALLQWVSECIQWVTTEVFVDKISNGPNIDKYVVLCVVNLDDTVSLISFNDSVFVLFYTVNLALGCACRRKTEQWKLMTSEPASSPWDMTWYGDTDAYGCMPCFNNSSELISNYQGDYKVAPFEQQKNILSFFTIHILAKLRDKVCI